MHAEVIDTLIHGYERVDTKSRKHRRWYMIDGAEDFGMTMRQMRDGLVWD